MNSKFKSINSGISPNKLFYLLNHLYEVPMKLTTLVCVICLGPNQFVIESREELKQKTIFLHLLLEG